MFPSSANIQLILYNVIFFIFFIFYFLGGKKPVEVHAAVWVPDNEATICMHCNKTQFTVLNRRVMIKSFLLNGQSR